MHRSDSNGIVYPSVRRAGGQCVGALRPKAVGRPIQARHLQYFWDGHRISRYFDYLERWIGIEDGYATTFSYSSTS